MNPTHTTAHCWSVCKRHQFPAGFRVRALATTDECTRVTWTTPQGVTTVAEVETRYLTDVRQGTLFEGGA